MVVGISFFFFSSCSAGEVNLYCLLPLRCFLSCSTYNHWLLTQVSWCKFEFTINSPKAIGMPLSSKYMIEIPPMVVTAINLKTIMNEKQNAHEIVSASIICCQKAKVLSDPLLALLFPIMGFPHILKLFLSCRWPMFRSMFSSLMFSSPSDLG